MFPQPQITGPPTLVTFDPELSRKVDIVEEQINFSSARKQFLQPESDKRGPAPQIYSAKPFARTKVGEEGSCPDAGDAHVSWSDEGLGGEFTCARAVMTIVHEDEDDEVSRRSPAHLEESDSGLDELSVRSQDTAPFSLDSTPFSLDSVSDSGASLPPTPQPLTPVNGQTNCSPTEDELEFHAGVLVQNALRSALEAEGTGSGSFEPSQLGSPPTACSPASPPRSSSSSSFSSPDSWGPAPSGRRPDVETAPPSSPPSLPASSPPPQQQQQRPRNAGPRIKIQSSYARALASSTPTPPPPPAPTTAVTSVPRPTPVYRPPSPPSPDKPEFSYFSKYSEAAELRSTAAPASRAPEAEPASGPFRLRSKKQRTLSMIEEEIRAAQQREEELKKQRETQPPQVVVRNSGHVPGRGRPPTTITPADKMKSNSLPAKLTLTARTAPG